LQNFTTLSIFLAHLSISTTSFYIVFAISPQDFFNAHFGNKKQLEPTCRKQKQRVIVMFATFEALSPHFMKWHFTFHFRANVLMTRTFFTLFDTCHFPLKFILTSTWATLNTC